MLTELLPTGAVGAEGVEPGDRLALWPEEEAMVTRAVPARRREVAEGRSCARRALATLGAPVGAIPAGADRAPRWPSGVVGSITHTQGFVAAVVGWDREVGGLGIDAEHVSRVRPGLAPSIAGPGERAWLDTLDPDRAARGLALLFSAKEAAHKCQFPRTRLRLDFLDASVELDRDMLEPSGQLLVRFHVGVAQALSPIRCRYRFSADLIVIVACLQPG